MIPIPIDKGVPLPVHRNNIYPFEALEVGDSFFLSGKSQDFISGSASHYARKLSRRFTVRNVDGGVRVWRVA